MSRSQVLYHLQQVDLEMETLARRLKAIGVGLGDSAVVMRARQRAADAETRLHTCHGSTTDLDLEVHGLGQRIQTNEQRLYGGRVASPKELSSLQEDVVSLKRWLDKKEVELLEAMMAEEEAEASLAEARAARMQADEALQTEQAKLVAEQSQLQSKQQDLAEQRAFLVESAAKDDMADYERLRPRKDGRAVAALKGGVCQGCHMPPPLIQVQQAGAGAELVFCNNCGRVLHMV